MTVTTLSLRPTLPWRTPDAGTGREVLRVTLLRMNAEQQPCLRACRRLLRQPWTLGVTLDRMGRGLCPGGELISDDVQASISNNSFEDIMEAVRNERHYSDISAEGPHSTPDQNRLAFLSALQLTTRPTPLPPGQFQHGHRRRPRTPSTYSRRTSSPGSLSQRSQGPLRSWHAPSPSRPPPLVGASGCLSSQSGAFGYLPGSFATLQGPSTSHWPAPFPGLALLTFLPGLPCGTASQQTALQTLSRPQSLRRRPPTSPEDTASDTQRWAPHLGISRWRWTTWRRSSTRAQ